MKTTRTNKRLNIQDWNTSTSKVKKMLYQAAVSSVDNGNFDYYMNMAVKIIASYK